MSAKPPRGLFITGTGTGVGKTYVGRWIAAELHAGGHRVGVYKPVASGCARDAERVASEDALALWEAAGRPGTLGWVCPQRFLLPVAPHLAARAEGREVDSVLLRSGLANWANRCDVVVVEGAGGLLSPISDHEYVADLARDLGYPLVIVAVNELGVINATLQTLIAAKACCAGVSIAGIVLTQLRKPGNDPSMVSNRAELARRCDRPVLAEAPYGERLDTVVDWFGLACG